MQHVRTQPKVQADRYTGKLHAAHDAQDWALLTRLCKQTLRKDGGHQTAHRYLGYALKMQNQMAAASEAFTRAMGVLPTDAELPANYGNLLLDQARYTDALPVLEKLCSLRPTDPVSWLKVAQCCYSLGLHDKGLGSALVAEKFAVTTEQRAAVLTQKAIHRRELGQIREAVQDCAAAIALNPVDASNHTNRLLFMLGDPTTSPEQLTEAAKAYAAVFEPAYKPHWPSYQERSGDPWRKLKIGFLSPDFRVHAVMCFAEGVLAQLDRRQFEVYAFHLHPGDDQVTERVKRHADHFVRFSGVGFDEQAARIQAHEIDILIDMTGHTGNNALLTMVRKPAPVQVTWLGFVASTGLTAIDYYLTDEVINPAGVEHLFSEKLFRLSTYAGSYRASSRHPLWRYQPLYAVRPTPALRNGYITFGSCNNLGKLTDDVLRLWAQLLAEVPTARLLIEGKGFGKAAFAESYKSRCADLGIDVTRLDLLALDTTKQYLAYHDIDIALDPFPLTGGTTTCDVLWMGVPLVSMVGKSSPSRMSTDALTYLGRTEWLASSEDDYLRISLGLAANLEKLNALRLSLRDEVEQSPLMRDDLVCRHFGRALRTMWMRWLAQREHPTDLPAQASCVEAWQLNQPQELLAPPTPGVGVSEGKRVGLPEAHQQLQALVDEAKSTTMSAHSNEPNTIEGKHWIAATVLAQQVLDAVPNDAVALASLAEVEHAHGHPEFAVTYMQYAVKAINRMQATKVGL